MQMGRLAFQCERWAPGDVRIGDLPVRRVIWAARNKDLVVVHFEQGGFVNTYHIIVAETPRVESDYRLLGRRQVHPCGTIRNSSRL